MPGLVPVLALSNCSKATYTKPVQNSAGILYIMVNGTLVVEEGKIVPDIYPVEDIRADQAWGRHKMPVQDWSRNRSE